MQILIFTKRQGIDILRKISKMELGDQNIFNIEGSLIRIIITSNVF